METVVISSIAQVKNNVSTKPEAGGWKKKSEMLRGWKFLRERAQKRNTFHYEPQFRKNSQPIPSAFYGFNHDVAGEGVSKRSGSAVIEEDEHRGLGAAEQEGRQGFVPRIRSPL